MQYSEGQIGRVFVVRIDDGEDLLVSLHRFIGDKGIEAGSVIFLGALMEGKMVTGPEKPVIPPDPHFVFFEGGWEIFGIGTIYPGDGGAHIHIHASVGRAGHALTGCLREKAQTYLIVEAIIYEITGLSARREFDEKMQLHLPVLKDPRAKDMAQATLPGEEPDPAKTGEKNNEKSELSGGLAEIIRDLTKKPPV